MKLLSATQYSPGANELGAATEHRIHVEASQGTPTPASGTTTPNATLTAAPDQVKPPPEMEVELSKDPLPYNVRLNGIPFSDAEVKQIVQVVQSYEAWSKELEEATLKSAAKPNDLQLPSPPKLSLVWITQGQAKQLNVGLLPDAFQFAVSVSFQLKNGMPRTVTTSLFSLDDGEQEITKTVESAPSAKEGSDVKTIRYFNAALTSNPNLIESTAREHFQRRVSYEPLDRFDRPFKEPAKTLLQNAAAKKNFVSRYWITSNRAATVFGATLRDSSQKPVRIDVTWSSADKATAPGTAQGDGHKFVNYYNADQFSIPTADLEARIQSQAFSLNKTATPKSFIDPQLHSGADVSDAGQIRLSGTGMAFMFSGVPFPDSVVAFLSSEAERRQFVSVYWVGKSEAANRGAIVKANEIAVQLPPGLLEAAGEFHPSPLLDTEFFNLDQVLNSNSVVNPSINCDGAIDLNNSKYLDIYGSPFFLTKKGFDQKRKAEVIEAMEASGYSSRYWFTYEDLRGATARCALRLGEKSVPKVSALLKSPMFNGDQTKAPNWFSTKNCFHYVPRTLDGTLLSDTGPLVRNLHDRARHLRTRSAFWFTPDELTKRLEEFKTKAEAEGGSSIQEISSVSVKEKEAPVAGYFNAFQTTNPELVEKVARSLWKYRVDQNR
jgi:hypothetical protein